MSTIPFTTRVRRGLVDNAGIKTVRELLGYTGPELMRIQYFGLKSLREVRERLAERGLELKDEQAPHPAVVRYPELYDRLDRIEALLQTILGRLP